MSTNWLDFLPTIQVPPAPTDAELEAERDAKHRAEVERWMATDQKYVYLSGWHAHAALVRKIIGAMQDETHISEANPDPTRAVIARAERVALLRALERIEWQSRDAGVGL